MEKIDSIQLKEVNDLIDNDIEYSREMEIANLATRICIDCKHYDTWHTPEGCMYKSDGFTCDCDETEIEFK